MNFVNAKPLTIILLLTYSLVSAEPISQANTDHPIYVIGSQEDAFLTPGSAQFISKKQIKKFNYSDPVRLLQGVTGVYLQEEDGYGLRPNIGLRGATPHRSQKITLMEDGILIAPAPYSAPSAYFFPNIMKVSSVEVFKGASSVKFGPNSIGGAINFVTNQIPQKKQNEVGITYGDINKYEISTGDQKRKYGYLVEYNRMKADGFKKLPSNGNTGFEKNDLMLKGKYNFFPYKQKVLLKTSYSTENSHETYLGLTQEDFKKTSYNRYAASSNDLMKWQHQQYQLQYSISPRQDTKVNTAIYYHKFNRNWSKFSGFKNGVHVSNYLDPGSENFNSHFLEVLRGEADSKLSNGDDNLIIGNNHRKYYSAGISVKTNFLFNQSKGISHNFSLGLRYHQDQMKKLDTKDSFQMHAGQLVNLNQRKNSSQYINATHAKTLFLEDEIDFLNGLIISAGIRMEDVQNQRKYLTKIAPALKNKYQVIAPGIGMQYSFFKVFNLIAGVNRGVSTVSPGQANDITPEESINYEAGVKYKGLFRGEFIGFFNDYKNIKGFCSFSSGCDRQNLDQEFNGGKAKVYGFESQVSKEFKLFAMYLPMEFSYTKTIAKFTQQTLSINPEWGIGQIRKGGRLPYIPKDKLSLSLGTRYKKASHFLNYNWQSLVYDQTVEKNRKTINGYGIFDWIGKYKYSKNGEAFFKIDNLFAKKYIVSLKPFGARPGKSQSFNLGIRHLF